MILEIIAVSIATTIALTLLKIVIKTRRLNSECCKININK